MNSWCFDRIQETTKALDFYKIQMLPTSFQTANRYRLWFRAIIGRYSTLEVGFRSSRPGISNCQLTRHQISGGYGPVVDLANDPINAALLLEVRLLSLPQSTRGRFWKLTFECPMLEVLGGRRVGRW